MWESHILCLKCLIRVDPSPRVNEEQLAQLNSPKGHNGNKKDWLFRCQTSPCLQERNALLLMLVLLVQRLREQLVVIFFFFFAFCSSSEVMNGNGYSASSDVSRSSLFCAAKHDLWQEREGESLTSPFALLYFSISSKRSLGVLDWHSNCTHLVWRYNQAPFQASQPFEVNRWKGENRNMMLKMRE